MRMNPRANSDGICNMEEEDEYMMENSSNKQKQEVNIFSEYYEEGLTIPTSPTYTNIMEMSEYV